MADFRRNLTLDDDARYWYADMGELNHLNGPASYPFPTEFAAYRFGAAHKRRAPDRDIAVRDPDGTSHPITLPDLGEIDYDED